MSDELNHGIVFWLTGLSSAGKTENARRVAKYLRGRGRPCVLLDGDELREVINADKKCYTRSERVYLGLQYGKLCRLIASHGVDVVIATIALYQEIHDWKQENLPNCCTIYIDVPLEELRNRDPKRIYARYFAKELNHVAGLDLQVDLPPNPEITLKWLPGMDRDKFWNILEQRINDFLARNS